MDVPTPRRDHDIGDPRPRGEPPCGDPDAVAGHLRHGAVRVPDDHVGVRIVARVDLEHPVRADARRVVAQAPDALGCERAGILPLDDQVRVAERMPLLEAHRPGRLPLRQSDDLVCHLSGGPLAVERDEPGDPSHPLPLVGGVAARPDDDALERLRAARAARSRRGRAPSPPSARAAPRERPAPPRRPRPRTSHPRAPGCVARGRRSRPPARRSASGDASHRSTAALAPRRATGPSPPARAHGPGASDRWGEPPRRMPGRARRGVRGRRHGRRRPHARSAAAEPDRRGGGTSRSASAARR